MKAWRMSLTLQEVRDLLSCEVVVDPGGLDQIEIERGGGADLMSDVLAFVNPGALLLTGLTNAQTVRTALVVATIPPPAAMMSR